MTDNTFIKAMQFRHACKLFDKTKQIPEETMRYILECGRLSPFVIRDGTVLYVQKR